MQNFFVAAAGNMVGGIAFVTCTRTGQAIGSSDGDGPVDEEGDDGDGDGDGDEQQ